MACATALCASICWTAQRWEQSLKLLALPSESRQRNKINGFASFLAAAPRLIAL
jgi:hypothetical protein